MNAPLGVLRDSELTTLFMIATGATLVWFSLFPRLEPNIIRLELAPTTTRVRKIVGAWTARGLLGDAKRSVVIDLAWIPLYTAMLASAAVLAERAAAAAEISPLVALPVYVALAAGVLDYLENAGLWLLLTGHEAQPWPALTTLVSGLKWLAIVLVAAGAVAAFACHGAQELCAWIKDR